MTAMAAANRAVTYQTGDDNMLSLQLPSLSDESPLARWQRGEPHESLTERLHVLGGALTSLGAVPEQAPPLKQPRSPRSDTAATRATTVSESARTTGLYSNSSSKVSSMPGLAHSIPTASSKPISSGAADSYLHSRLPRVDEDGELISDEASDEAEAVVFPCTFDCILNCPLPFTDPVDWAIHCNSHFLGKPAPNRVSCPHCSEWSTPVGQDAWVRRLEHVAEHCINGEVRHGRGHATRVDLMLAEHLWRIKVIDNARLQELKTPPGRRGRSEAYTVTESRRNQELRGSLGRAGHQRPA